MKRYLPFVIVLGIALVTLGSGAALYRAKRPQVKNIPDSPNVATQKDASAHVRGNADAPFTLEEFGDFQCPPCGQFAGFAEELLKEYDSRLRVVFETFHCQATNTLARPHWPRKRPVSRENLGRCTTRFTRSKQPGAKPQ